VYFPETHRRSKTQQHEINFSVSLAQHFLLFNHKNITPFSVDEAKRGTKEFRIT
jgi:hypothetical protein